jgi:hypothetical protein
MMKKKGMAKGGYRGGVKKMKKGGAVGGVAEELNPGKTMDVTQMAMGGMVDDKMVNRMMGGGRPKGMAKGGAAGGLNAAIKRVKANK